VTMGSLGEEEMRSMMKGYQLAHQVEESKISTLESDIRAMVGGGDELIIDT